MAVYQIHSVLELGFPHLHFIYGILHLIMCLLSILSLKTHSESIRVGWGREIELVQTQFDVRVFATKL